MHRRPTDDCRSPAIHGVTLQKDAVMRHRAHAALYAMQVTKEPAL